MEYPVFKSENYLMDGEQFNIHQLEVSDVYPHTHEFIEMVYIESGEGVHILGDQEQQVQQGDLFIMNTNVPHSFVSSEHKKTLSVINCLFTGEFLDMALADCKEHFLDSFYHFFFESYVCTDGKEPKFIRLTGGRGAGFRQTILEMHEEYERKRNGYQAVIRACLTTLLIKVFRKYQELYQAKDLTASGKEVVEHTMQYIRENCEQDLHLHQLASRVYLSPSYLSRLFKKYTNQTLTQFIQRERVEEVCRLLRTTRLSVEAAAEEVGYHDMKTFYEVFKKQTGTTPGAYRKERDKNPYKEY